MSENVTVQPFKYEDGIVPAGYKCGECNVFGVKLWRDYQTFLDHQSLRCMKCACEEQEKDYPIDLERSDQIGWRIPAVPTEEGDTYWGYTSVPQPGCDWWDNLPETCEPSGGELCQS